MSSGAETIKRRRGASATRAAILEAARHRFVRDGYDGATVREVANDAGVNHALIARYFGSKEELFAEVLACSPDPHDLFQGDPSTFGARLAKILVYEPPDNAALDGLLIILRSAGSAAAAAMIREAVGVGFYGPLAAWLGGEDADVRARYVGAVIIGFAVSRAIHPMHGLDAAQQERLCGLVAQALQASLGEAPPR